MFNRAATQALDENPQYVQPVAQRHIEAMGFDNVHFETFNKAAGKPAEIVFTVEKEGLPYQGTAYCSSSSCERIDISL